MCEIPFGKTVTYGWIAEKIAGECGYELFQPFTLPAVSP